MRHHDWPEILHAYIGAREAQRFQWGRRAQDCCSFAFGGALEISGVDAMADIEDYASAEQADLILARISMAEVADAHFQRVPIGMLKRGDLALTKNIKDEDTLMIVEGANLVGPGARRLIRVPRAKTLIGWSV